MGMPWNPGCREHNLKNLDVRVPLGVFVCVTGVSGSGKSTLTEDILHRKVSYELYGSKGKPGEHDSIRGIEYLDKVVDIDQSPIGRTPRSNPATYTGVFDLIRDVYSRTHRVQDQGLQAGTLQL